MAKLELSHITKKFGDKIALKDVSFTCKDGEFFVVLGASGAGKSTTINIISGLEPPNQGQVFLEGADITRSYPQERNLATAFESYALYPHFTVFQNLLFPLETPERKRQTTKEARETRVREVAELLGISELLKRYPRELSGGQKQRVALGRTLVRRPKVYLLDEPIAHLDAKLRHRMRSELKKIQRDMGITTLYCTPDQLEALSMADTVAVLHEGVIEQIGTPDEIYYRPVNRYVASFVGDPPMNVFKVYTQDDHVIVECDIPYRVEICPEDQVILANQRDSRKILIGIRPKDISLLPLDDPHAHTRGTVTLLDTLGQTSIVTIRIHTTEIKVKTSSDNLPRINETIGLRLDDTRFYYFNASTDLAIR